MDAIERLEAWLGAGPDRWYTSVLSRNTGWHSFILRHRHNDLWEGLAPTLSEAIEKALDAAEAGL